MMFWVKLLCDVSMKKSWVRNKYEKVFNGLILEKKYLKMIRLIWGIIQLCF